MEILNLLEKHIVERSPELKLGHLEASYYTPKTGIYFLLHGEEVVYVGQSKDIVSRVKTHKTEPYPMTKKNFDGVYYFECEAPDLDFHENYFIELFLPKYNTKLYNRPIKRIA